MNIDFPIGLGTWYQVHTRRADTPNHIDLIQDVLDSGGGAGRRDPVGIIRFSRPFRQLQPEYDQRKSL